MGRDRPGRAGEPPGRSDRRATATPTYGAEDSVMSSPVRRSRGNGQSTDTRMIMLTRHAEKPLHPAGSPYGVNPQGQQDPHSLTVNGWIRAGALVALFAPSRGEPPA